MGSGISVISGPPESWVLTGFGRYIDCSDVVVPVSAPPVEPEHPGGTEGRHAEDEPDGETHGDERHEAGEDRSLGSLLSIGHDSPPRFSAAGSSAGSTHCHRPAANRTKRAGCADRVVGQADETGRARD